MIPLKDNVPTRTFPIITIAIVLVNTLVFAWSLTLPTALERSIVHKYALIPRDLTIAYTTQLELLPYNVMTIFTSMFLHGGFLHIAGNMLYLWIFGNNVEDAAGHRRFLVFYLLSGVAAALVQCSFDPASPVPMIGASGAVSGVLGAYLVLFPRAKVKTLLFVLVFIATVDIPAMLLLTIWFFFQVAFSHGLGVAWFAHIGGFVFGLVSVKIFTWGRQRPRVAW